MSDDWNRPTRPSGDDSDDAFADHSWSADVEQGEADDTGWEYEAYADEEVHDLGEEWIDHQGPSSTRSRWLAVLGVGVLVVVLVLGAGWVWIERQVDPPGAPGAEVELEIVEGSTTAQIGEFLADNDIIASASVWDYWTRFNDKGPFQAGIYVFRENSSFDQAVAVLDAGPRPPENVRVTIPEGLTVEEILPRLADPERGVERWTVEAMQAALQSGEIRSRFQPADASSMEGLLFPETYEIEDETDERTFLRRLVTQLDETLVALDVETRAAALGRTPYEIVIIASLIEEEAKVDDDRGKISRVIHNRLEQGIALGIDATSRYEAEIEGRDREDIDFTSDSPYNTRRVRGLPPTPIAAPGRASLEAALAPEAGDWIYYVLTEEDGHHTFAETEAEFLRAKRICIEKDLGCG